MTKRNTKPREQEWQLQEAKARFSELFNEVRRHGPQRVTRHGKEAVVVLSAEQYERLKARKRQPARLSEFFAASPLAAAGVALERDPDYGRSIDL